MAALDLFQVAHHRHPAGLAPRRQVREHQRRAHAVLVPDHRAHRIAQRLLVAEDEPGAFAVLALQRPVGNPLEAGEHLVEGGAQLVGDLPKLHGRDDGGGHVGLGLLRPLGEQVMPQQHPHLVAGEHAQRPVLVPRHHRQPVRIRIIGEDQVRLVALGGGDGEIHRARLLGVGKAHRGKGAIWLLLLGHGVEPREAGGLHGPLHPHPAHPVHGGVDNGERLRPPSMQAQPEDGLEVRLAHRLRDVAPEASRPGLGGGQQPHLIGRLHRVDGGGDALIVRGDDLRAVAPVDLVAVVLRGIVAGGDHHRRTGPQAQRGERRQGRGHEAGEDERGDPFGGQHTRGVLGELGAHPAPIPADDHAPGHGLGHLGLEIARQPRRGAAHHGPVHPVGTGPQHPAQPRGAKLQVSREAIRQVRRIVLRQHPPQLLGRRGVRVRLPPRFRLLSQSDVAHVRLRSPSGARGPCAMRSGVVGELAPRGASLGLVLLALAVHAELHVGNGLEPTIGQLVPALLALAETVRIVAQLAQRFDHARQHPVRVPVPAGGDGLHHLVEGLLVLIPADARIVRPVGLDLRGHLAAQLRMQGQQKGAHFLSLSVRHKGSRASSRFSTSRWRSAR
ncbi:hypothetical protein STIAU_7739 [Stigmatella aurantiaca DW4/3-1]|uniref:Uncharacterized protein n=1 Tax=Stigmatella aurantiaca (strain DW4/3-1) TaxID=378806 RepID=Q098Q6_STIAD|nr:hypothetical protein STIAU_7739 [Stigmatella aurantiaca DW4/3-1]